MKRNDMKRNDMKRNGKKQFRSRQIREYLGWKGLIKRDNRGMGTVEVILIIVVLVGLVIIFKGQITAIVNSLFGQITSQTSTL